MFDVTNHVSFAIHGGGDSGGGVAGNVDKFLAFAEGLVSQTPSEIFASVMPGISALENLHPLFVHFPIALLSLFVMLDVIGSIAGKQAWRQVATWFLYFGALFAGMTVAAGLIAANSVAHGGDVHEIMERHEHLGISVFLLAVGLSAWRMLARGGLVGAVNNLYLLFAGLMAALLVLTADLGGLMVFKYGVAVVPVTQLNKEAAALHQHGAAEVETEQVVHDHPESPVAEPEPVDRMHHHADGTAHHHTHAH